MYAADAMVAFGRYCWAGPTVRVARDGTTECEIGVRGRGRVGVENVVIYLMIFVTRYDGLDVCKAGCVFRLYPLAVGSKMIR